MVGNYQHTLDTKGRLFIPSKQRAEIDSNCLYLTRGLNKCIACYTEAEWEKYVEKLKSVPQMAARNLLLYVLGNSVKSEIDAQGRISIPANLCSMADLKQEVTIVGLQDHLELWDTTRWNEFNSSVSEEEIIAALTALGL